MRISIIIPTIGRSVDLGRCLAALKIQVRKPDEVIVVIGPGDKDAVAVFEAVSTGTKGWRSLASSHCSVVESLNLGLAAATGEIVALTDDDAEAPDDWLKRMEGHYLADDKVGAVGGRDRLMLRDEPKLANPSPAVSVGQYNWYGWLSGNHSCGAVRSPLEVDSLKGVNFSFRQEAFPAKRIDQYLVFRGAEVGWEIDICQSIQQAGWKIIYDNEVHVLHHVGRRIAGDDRVEIATPMALRRAQNNSYLMAVYRPTIQAFLVLARSVLLGSRRQPGLAWGVVSALTGRSAHLLAALKLAKAHWRGVVDGRAKRARRKAGKDQES
jgi:glycosyltransferase involved in cell wall biosynthesis